MKASYIAVPGFVLFGLWLIFEFTGTRNASYIKAVEPVLQKTPVINATASPEMDFTVSQKSESTCCFVERTNVQIPDTANSVNTTTESVKDCEVLCCTTLKCLMFKYRGDSDKNGNCVLYETAFVQIGPDPQYHLFAKESCQERKPILPFKKRNDIGLVLEAEGMKIGAELGVQKGGFARATLDNWPSCEKYVLVDLWAHQENYKDAANVNQEKQNENYDETMKNTAKHVEKLEVCRNYTTSCAPRYPDGYFDFVYVDARHDRLGVLQDLTTWWPKVKLGGIMAGHDYVDIDDVHRVVKDDYTLNYDGTHDRTGQVVKGAVDDFFRHPDHYRQLTLSYREDNWNSWAVRR